MTAFLSGDTVRVAAVLAVAIAVIVLGSRACINHVFKGDGIDVGRDRFMRDNGLVPVEEYLAEQERREAEQPIDGASQ